MRPVDIQSIISGIKETEKVQRSQEVRRQQQAHDFEVTIKRKEREEPTRVPTVPRGELARVEEKRRREEKERGRSGRERKPGKEVKTGEEKAVYNGRGRKHPLQEGDGPHDLLV